MPVLNEQQVFNTNALIAGARRTPGIDGGRSFRRVLAFLGVSATAAAAWYGAFYLFNKYNRKRLAASASETFTVTLENANNVETGIETADGKVVVPQEEIDYDLRRKTVKVTLHQCPRGYYTPSVAPFPFKLETFLRVAGIPYEIDFSYQPANKTSPWMTIDGVDVIESHECVPLLCSTFGVDLEKSAKQQSRLTASRLVGVMLDNHIYWGIALWRWVYDAGQSLKVIQPLSLVGQDVVTEVSASVIRASWYHGLGRLTKEQVIDLVLVDLADLSAALGNHDYFLGQHPGEVDCNAFAMLSQMVWNMPDCPFEAAMKKYSNLVNFVLRMRENYWPDWDTLLQKPGDAVLPDKLLYPTGEFQISRAKITNDGLTVAGSSTSSVNNAAQPVIAHQSASNQQQYAQQFQQAYQQQQPKIQLPVDQGAQVYADGPAFPQGQGYPVLKLNNTNTVVNQDEKLLQQQRDQDAAFQQRVNEMNYLNHVNKLDQLRGYDQASLQAAIAAQQYIPGALAHYYQQQAAAAAAVHYDPSQLDYQYANVDRQYEQPGPNYLAANNPFIPPEQVSPQGYILAGSNSPGRALRSRSQQYGPTSAPAEKK